jgi:uncharacterized protein
MRRHGHRPVPFREFILKVHSRCNLSCSYCYVYEMADQTWRQLPRQMSYPILQAAAGRIDEHVRQHRLPSIEIVLHGGEPLLTGPSYLAELTGLLQNTISANLKLAVQTNGTLLDRPMLETVRDLGIRVGVSLDGGLEATGRHRRYANGTNSFTDVADGLRLITSPEFRDIYGGILCAVDTRNDPVATYEELLSFDPPTLDLLLPHANWSSPPPGSGYADWLIAVFERWYSAPVLETRIRLFDELIQLILGGSAALESVGLQPAMHIVVDTDGTIKQLDSLSSTYPEAASTGLHVLTDPFDAALDHPTTVAMQIGIDALSSQCRACQVMRICGGGLYPHRYRRGEGFRNPSVYCTDLIRLIEHMTDRVLADMAWMSEQAGDG